LDLPQDYLAKQYFLLTPWPRASGVLNFRRLFPAEVERKFKSWSLNFCDKLVVTNWLNTYDELVVKMFWTRIVLVFNSLYFYCIFIVFTLYCSLKNLFLGVCNKDSTSTSTSKRHIGGEMCWRITKLPVVISWVSHLFFLFGFSIVLFNWARQEVYFEIQQCFSWPHKLSDYSVLLLRLPSLQCEISWWNLVTSLILRCSFHGRRLLFDRVKNIKQKCIVFLNLWNEVNEHLQKNIEHYLKRC